VARLEGLRASSVYVVQGSRGLIAAALELDVVVDDRHENCYDVVVDSGARAILVWRGGRAVLRRGRSTSASRWFARSESAWTSSADPVLGSLSGHFLA
jgi:hypothetical protein